MISPLPSLPHEPPSIFVQMAPAGRLPEKSRVDWKATKRPSLLIRGRLLALSSPPVVWVICVKVLLGWSKSMISEFPSGLLQGLVPSPSVQLLTALKSRVDSNTRRSPASLQFTLRLAVSPPPTVLVTWLIVSLARSS